MNQAESFKAVSESAEERNKARIAATLVIIGRGMMWSEEFDTIATVFAELIEEEFSVYSDMNSHKED